jgi:hypothetical protein
MPSKKKKKQRTAGHEFINFKAGGFSNLATHKLNNSTKMAMVAPFNLNNWIDETGIYSNHP